MSTEELIKEIDAVLARYRETVTPIPPEPIEPRPEVTDPVIRSYADLIPRASVTHIAVRDGEFNDPATWEVGTIPDETAIVEIPPGRTVRFEGKCAFDWCIVFGILEVAKGARITLDTLIGMPGSDVRSGWAADAVFQFRTAHPIDTSRDATLISRGLRLFGDAFLSGQQKWHALPVAHSVDKGSTRLTLGGQTFDHDRAAGEDRAPWEAGDRIQLTTCDYVPNTDDAPWTEHQEVRKIAGVEVDVSGATVLVLDEPTVFSYEEEDDEEIKAVWADKMPGSHTWVGRAWAVNLTRSLRFECTDPLCPPSHRPTVEIARTRDASIRWASFECFGRTDASAGTTLSEFDLVAPFDPGANLRNRDAVGIRHCGRGDNFYPLVGCVIDDGLVGPVTPENIGRGSYGVGIAIENCDAQLLANTTVNIIGAHVAAIAGNERGVCVGHVAAGCWGVWGKITKNGPDAVSFEVPRAGDALFTRSRMYEFKRCAVFGADNYAHAVMTRTDYRHPDFPEFEQNAKDVDGALTDPPFAEGLYAERLFSSVPALTVSGIYAVGCRGVSQTIKPGPQSAARRSHRFHCVGWRSGDVHIEYAANYTEDLHILAAPRFLDGISAKQRAQINRVRKVGFSIGANCYNISAVGCVIANFKTGFRDYHTYTRRVPDDLGNEERQVFLVNSTFINVDEPYGPEITPDQILDGVDTNDLALTFTLDEPGVFDRSGEPVIISGRIRDALGDHVWPVGGFFNDTRRIRLHNLGGALSRVGYWRDPNTGETFTVFSTALPDRLTNAEPLRIDIPIRFDGIFGIPHRDEHGAPIEPVFNGERSYADTLSACTDQFNLRK